MGLLVTLGAVVTSQMAKDKKKKEGFAIVEGPSANANWAFGSRIYPRPGQVPQQSKLSWTAPGNMGGVPAQPYAPIDPSQLPSVSFATMGGGFGGAAGRPYGTMTSQQAQNALHNKMNGGKPEYFQPELPATDIGSSVNPAEMGNFVADRSVFAPLKRRYANGVDHIRGDLPIEQQRHGWFDVRPASQKDVVQGYFQGYLDLQQSSSLRDAAFTRTSPTETLLTAAASPAGDTSLVRSTYV